MYCICVGLNVIVGHLVMLKPLEYDVPEDPKTWTLHAKHQQTRSHAEPLP